LATGQWAGDGIASPEHWVKLRLGVSHPRAKTFVTAGRRFAEFPETMAEFAQCGLSLEQVETVVTRAPAWADPRMARFAGALTVPQLQRVLRDEFFDGPAPEAADDPASGEVPGDVAGEGPAVADGQPADRFSYAWDRGRLVGSFDLAADRGTALEAAIGRIADELFRTTGTPVANADTFAEIFARAAASVGPLLSLEWGNGSRLADTLGRHRTFLHLALTDDAQQLLAHLSNGVRLPDAIVHYLTCDGSVTPVWIRDNIPIGYGRDQRIVPVKMRRHIEYRDRGCRVPGCGAKHIEIHHLIHWSHGGATETINLVSLCPRHHRMHHTGQLHIRGNPDQPDGLEFLDTTGNPIRGPSPIKPVGPPPAPTKPFEPPTGERMDLRYFIGWEHPDTHAERARQARQHWQN